MKLVITTFTTAGYASHGVTSPGALSSLMELSQRLTHLEAQQSTQCNGVHQDYSGIRCEQRMLLMPSKLQESAHALHHKLAYT